MTRKAWASIGISFIIILVIIFVITSYEKPVKLFQPTPYKKINQQKESEPGIYKVVKYRFAKNAEGEVKRIKDNSTIFKEYVNKYGEKKAFYCELNKSEESYERHFTKKGYIEYKKDGVVIGQYYINIGYGESLFDGKINQADINGDGRDEIILSGSQGGGYHCDGVAVFDLFNEREYYAEGWFSLERKSTGERVSETVVLSWSKSLALRECESIKQYSFSLINQQVPPDMSKYTYQYVK